MKYLKLYEAFDADAITSVLKFLDKKVGKQARDIFFNKLKALCDEYDIPISTINDNEVEYLSTRKALQVKNTEDVSNPDELYCLKYWFSLEKGLIDVTATGNLRMSFNKLSKKKSKKSNEFSPSGLEQVKADFNLSGVLTAVNMEDLNTGDTVVMYIGDEDDLAIGEIYKDERDSDYIQFFFFQNKLSGTNPEDENNGLEVPERYNIYNANARVYSYCWQLGELGDEYEDHSNINIYQEDGVGPLRYEESNEKDIMVEESPWDFNLSYSHGAAMEWTSKNSVDKFKDADFAIILYMDDILSSQLFSEDSDKPRNIKYIKQDRQDSRKGALALEDDTDIKSENILRYLNTLFDRFNINKDERIFNDLSSFISNITSGKYFLLSTYSTSNLYDLYSFSNFLVSLMNAKSQSDIDYYYDHLKRIYLIRKQSSNFYFKNINYVKSLSGKSLLPVPLNKRVIDIIDRFCKLGDDMNDYIKKGTYTTVEDLRSIYFILNSIEEFLKDSVFSLDEDMSYLIKRLNSDDFVRVDSALKILSSYTDEDYKKDLKKLELIEKHISYMLR